LGWDLISEINLTSIRHQVVTVPDVSTQFLEDIACQPLLDEPENTCESQLFEVDNSFMFLVY
jgi:hypothetical protein